MMKKIPLAFVLLALLAGCAMPGAVSPTPTIDINAIRTAAASTAIYQVTLAFMQDTPTAEPTATETPEPTFTPTPTVEVILEPVAGLATDNLTVRSEPRRGSDNLGGIFYNQKVSVVARNPQATWYYILWKDSPTGYAWTVSRAVQLQSSDITQLPVADYDANNNVVLRPPVLWEISGAPLPIPPVPQGDKIRPATIIAPANVRVCPSLGCLVLGVLQPGQAINMTGRYGDNEWAQFDFPSGPGGKAWIAREAIQITSEGFGGLPYFDALGAEITPEAPPPTPDPNVTPTVTYTPKPTPAGPLARVEADTIIYAEPNSLSAQVGALKAKDEIYITGISLIGAWYQIQYPAFTEGRAYISQKDIRVLGDMRKVPYFDGQGNILPTP
jgi:hypothetical protein